jgi:hypothetical protein
VGDDQATAEDMAAQARAMAAGAPTPEQVREMAERAMASEPADMTPDEIRALAAQAIGQAWQISYLLNRLAALTGAGESP